ncbi:response regulator transcription factor [Methylobacterium isbiliense]|jgi:DNA-binding NarL/FixJ family response regulator|uniref:Transcriptional regulatory protein RcsB n=1 Tax=Methylobacterium isbiliense TaxID=315478 RepID=A0ABQ4SKH9_9HYPH|nr:response regulator transcription factor [Methylobacterium isbiliense]MDN3624245.1 response regulator transcription factor [Methylobacterium isbiliense]GJE02274.1 Transcriptional regulatory protein RcsB [Methylobacterium isbiliense]
MSDAVRVLIIDEPSDLGAVFRATLEHAPALRTVGEDELRGPNGAALEGVALVFTPERSPAAVAALRERHPRLKVLVAFLTAEAQTLIALAQAGADAFVARSAPPQDVCAAILALAGGEPLPGGAAPQADAAADLGLTPREAEVLRFLSAGFSNKEVARRLTVSVRTVETHRLNLRRKTKTGRLKDLVQLARQMGLAPVYEGDAASQRAGGGARGLRHAGHVAAPH